MAVREFFRDICDPVESNGVVRVNWVFIRVVTGI